MDDLYGPPLPPGYVRPDDSEDDSSSETSSKNSSKSNDGGSKIIGPQIPKFLSKKRSHSSSSENEPDESPEQEKRSSIGPQLPLELQKHTNDENSGDEMFGPLPVSDDFKMDHIDDARVAIEKRAEKMKNKLDNKDLPTVSAIQREEWMTVPDTSRKNQLGAISRCLAPEKSSSKSKKHSHYHNKEKDRETTEELKKYNKSKRSESLLEMHKKSKELKDKNSSKDKKIERKAFDRDEIEVKHFSKQQVNSVIDKAKYLNSRFSAGNKQYL